MSRSMMLAGRGFLLLVFAIAILPACSGDGTGFTGAPAGIQWNATSTGASSGGSPPGAGGLLWVDPNSGLGGNVGLGNIVSTDLITYSTPTVYIADNVHPLSTGTTDRTVVQAESGLQQAINGYRSRALGGIGGGAGGGGLGGGGIGLPAQNSFLLAHEGLNRNARAHCKHYALYHPGPLGSPNPEGDSVNAGGVAPAGRLAKTGIRTAMAVELVVSGPEFPDFSSATNEMTSNFGEIITATRWTHFGVGYWRGGSQEHYWSVILAANPTP